MKNKTVTVLLTPGGGPGILAQVESLSRSEKYWARIILADSNPAMGNLYLPEVDARYAIPECRTTDFIPALLRLIEKENVQYMYSGLDEEMPVLAANRERIEETGCKLLLPPTQALENALDKKATHHIVFNKIRIPETYFIDESFDDEMVYKKLDGKILIKVTSSRGGRHIYIPENLEEYLFYIHRARRLMRENGLAFMVQRFVEGNEYNVSTLHDFDGNPTYAVSRRKFEKRSIKSTTIAAVIERRNDVIEQALTAIREMGLVPGFNNVECIVSQEDDKPYFIEINGGRTAAQDMNIVASGINITDFMIGLLDGEQVTPIPHPPDGLAILKIRKDVVVNIREIHDTPEP